MNKPDNNSGISHTDFIHEVQGLLLPGGSLLYLLYSY